jgi:hypothetical protein
VATKKGILALKNGVGKDGLCDTVCSSLPPQMEKLFFFIILRAQKSLE